MSNIHLIIMVAVLVMLGAFFSGTETGIYRLSRFRLRIGLEQKRSLFGVLDKLMADSSEVIFSMLLGNNLAANLASATVTYMFIRAGNTEGIAEFYASLIMTPTLFVFANLIPKNIYFHMADRLMPHLAPIAFAAHRTFVFCGAVGALKFLSKLFSRLFGSPETSQDAASAAQRPHIRQIIQDTQEEGMLSSVQTQIIERLVNMPSVSVNSVMTPIAGCKMLSLNSTKTDLLNILAQMPFRRLPVYREKISVIVGYIDIYEALSCKDDFSSLESFVKPLSAFNPNTPVIEALNNMRNNRLQIALVADLDRNAVQTPLGIVTMKDLVEEIVGELAEW